MPRLQKFLAECGVASRRESEKLIAEGRVTVNGVVAEVGASVDPESDEVAVNGKAVKKDGKVYVLLNKPSGVVTTVRDTHERKTVIDCIEGVRARIFPVGRLDMDVTGALLLTNDGELAHRLAHPKFGVEKVYTAWVEGIMTDETARKLAEGVQLEDGMTAPAKVKILSKPKNTTRVRLTLGEGRKREVKRMCEAVGHAVLSLRRISIAGMGVSELRTGEWRYLTESEVAHLYKLAGLE